MLTRGRTMAQAPEQLVGRAAELVVLDRALAEVEERRFAALALVGEPGIGKTRLLTELAARADQRGYVWLSGSASELERDLPFWLFVDALDEYPQGLEPRRLTALGDDVLADLAGVFPSLGRGTPAAEPQADERYRTHRAVRQLVAALAATRPLVLLLDDLHWADSGSIELLGSLLRRPPSTGVLLAMALRPRQLPERLSGVLERAHAEAHLTRLELRSLTADEAGELLGEGLRASHAAAIYAESGGNPFYLEQLARFPGREPDRMGADGGVALAGVQVPGAVAAALADELALVPADIRRVLEGAAVAGDPFEPELAAAAADVAEDVAVDALDDLLRRDLVRQTEVPRRFRFRHPLVRSAVYEAAPGGWRLRAHERSASALAAGGRSAVARAHHVERCARQGDLAAVAVLREAAQTIGPRAPATAARLLGAAIRLLPSETPAAERVELLGAQAQAQVAAGQFQAAHSSLLECLDVLPDDSAPVRLRLTSACAGMENLLGRHEDAHARLMRALGELPDSDSTEGVGLMLELAVDALYRMEYPSMADWARRALEAARPLGDRPLTASGAGMLALAEAFSGTTAAAEAACTEGAALVDSMSDEQIARRIDWAIDTLAAGELYLDRYDEAGAHSARAIAVAEATGQGNVLPILFWTGMIRTACGRLAEAAAVLDTAIEMAQVANHAEGLAWNSFARSLAATAAGDAETALATAEQAVEATATSRGAFPAMGAGLALATALAAVDDPARAVDVLIETGGGEELSLVPACWRSAAFEVLTRSLLAAGRREEARHTAARAATLADELGTRLSAASADLAAAAVALDVDDPATAARRALASAAAADEVGAVVDAGVARVLAGRALAASGDKQRAVAELQRAASAFEAHGAVGRRDDAERELGKLGRRPHRRSRKGTVDATGIESLTERELEVARLIVERKTNSEIAATLFLSPKTVESHIRHLFHKLGASSRVEVARTVERSERAAR
jgi:DNA-binding CsgD family transcriptional regulator/tetratricopeptide (TPR) repeat protein